MQVCRCLSQCQSSIILHIHISPSSNPAQGAFLSSEMKSSLS
ncbi:hypothetical protein PVAP13_4KG181605 [Panicum virgatum]|uniref:Uncharacterized protein n=1 Tax=Panicum virgatum TaxID=38727 RepID=A0A8T0TUV5_PANVG|nr:hypothetical protein PVAP13_4KG181605 [Panicum virgatum]